MRRLHGAAGKRCFCICRADALAQLGKRAPKEQPVSLPGKGRSQTEHENRPGPPAGCRGGLGFCEFEKEESFYRGP